MNVIKISVLVILAVAVSIAYRVFTAASPPAESQAETAVQPRPASVSPPATPRTETTVMSNAASLVEEESDCITTAELNAHPLIRQFQSQADAAATNGADIEKFRGVDDASVRGYADQGDSAAMVVVGAMSVMRAFRVDASRAVDWLDNGGELEGVVMEQQQMSSDAGLALNDAAYWFYQAALHGKVFALQHYGQVRGQLFGGPVGLGWIEQQDLDALDLQQQQELRPGKIYARAAMRMNPAPDASAGQNPNPVVAGSEITERLLADIRSEFDAAIVDAGLPQPTASISDIEAYENLKSQVCVAELPPR
ncbi:MAG: hypothetical protein ACR2Q3_15680 [Woeseiaceae bacterium]